MVAKFHKNRHGIGVACSIIVILIPSIWLYQQNQKITEKTRHVHAHWQALSQQYERYLHQKNKAALSDKNESQQNTQIVFLSNLKKKRTLALKMLREIHESIPQSVTLQTLSYQGDSLILEGHADSSDAVLILMSSLKQSKVFSSCALKVLRKIDTISSENVFSNRENQNVYFSLQTIVCEPV